VTGWSTGRTQPTEEILSSLSTLLAPGLLRLFVYDFDQTLIQGVPSLCSLHTPDSTAATRSFRWSGWRRRIFWRSYLGVKPSGLVGPFRRGCSIGQPISRIWWNLKAPRVGHIPQGAFSKLRRFHHLAPGTSAPFVPCNRSPVLPPFQTFHF
jgi:hypothetical protein